MIERRELAIVMLALVALAAIAMVFTTLARLDRDDVQAANLALVSEQALVLADHATRVLEGAELALLTVIDDVGPQGWDDVAPARHAWRRARRLADRLPYVEAFSVYDDQGGLRLSSLTFPPPAMGAAESDFFTAVRAGGSGIVHLGGTGGAPASLRLSRRIESPDGRFRGVASVILQTVYFRTFYGTIARQNGTTVALLGVRDLRPLIQQAPDGDEPGVVHDPGRLEEAIAANPDMGSFLTVSQVDGVQRLIAYRKVHGYPLLVRISKPSSDTQAAWVERLRDRGWAAGATVMALALLTGTALRQSRRENAFRDQLERRVDERTAELAAANRHLESMMQEVHHRVRNNLQIIGSLVAMQSSRVTDDGGRAALAQTLGRVHTMSLLHQELYATGRLTDVAFVGYLRTLVRQLADIYGTSGVEVGVEGCDPALPLETAIPVALVVNEVLSNVLRHAFPDGRRGRVRITLAEAGQSLILTISDNGIGIPEAVHAPGGERLGLQIVRSLAAQLGGETALSGNDGTRFTLKFPRPAAGPVNST